MGTILGAFVSGLATRKTSEEKEATLRQTLTEEGAIAQGSGVRCEGSEVRGQNAECGIYNIS